MSSSVHCPSNDSLGISRYFSSKHFFQIETDQNTTSALLKRLSQSGRIESFNLQSTATATHGTVQFYQSQPNVTLPRCEIIVCNKVTVRLWPDEEQPTNGLTILDLNDFCLQKIFRLGMDDLTRVAKVNQRFQHNAGAVYALRMARFTCYDSLQHFAMKRYLESFGHLIKKLNIFSGREVDNSKLSLIATYGINITSLKVWGPHISNAVESFSLLFPRLRTLSVRGGLSQAFIDMLDACSNLTKLKLIDCKGDWQFTSINFPQLEKFRFEFAQDDDDFNDSHNINAFLANNPQLKQIKIKLSELGDDILLTISESLPLIETIEIVSVSGIPDIRLPYGEQRTCQHLKKLILGGEESIYDLDTKEYLRRYPEEWMKSLAVAKAPLEHLEIYTTDIPPNNFIGEFEKLSVLMLPGLEFQKYESRKSVTLKILEKLRELTELHLNDCFEFDEDDFVALVRRNTKLKFCNFAYKFHFTNDFDPDIDLDSDSDLDIGPAFDFNHGDIDQETIRKLKSIFRNEPDRVPFNIEKSYSDWIHTQHRFSPNM